MTSSSHKT